MTIFSVNLYLYIEQYDLPKILQGFWERLYLFKCPSYLLRTNSWMSPTMVDLLQGPLSTAFNIPISHPYRLLIFLELAGSLQCIAF